MVFEDENEDETNYPLAKEGGLLNRRVIMETWELLRCVFRKHGCKRVAAELGLSESIVHKWSRPPESAGTGAPNPLDKLADILRVTGDERLVQWICARAGGHFVRNRPGKPAARPQLWLAADGVLERMAQLQEEVCVSAKDGKVTKAEAAELRKRWDRLQSDTEEYVAECEGGDFQSQPRHQELCQQRG